MASQLNYGKQPILQGTCSDPVTLYQPLAQERMCSLLHLIRIENRVPTAFQANLSKVVRSYSLINAQWLWSTFHFSSSPLVTIWETKHLYFDHIHIKSKASGQTRWSEVKWMSNCTVLCTRAAQADLYRCITYFTGCTTVLSQEVPIAIAHTTAYTSSECDKLIARHTLDFAL